MANIENSDRVHYSEDSRKIIQQVLKTCKEEKRAGQLKVPLNAAFRRAAIMTGVCEATVQRIGKDSETPERARKLRSDKYVLDNFDKCVIWRTVQEMIDSRKTVPTCKCLVEVLKEKINYRGGEHHLRRILKALGFSWKRVGSNRKQLMERSDIVFLRAQFLRKMKKFRELGRPIIYTDETFVHAAHMNSKCWQSDDVVLAVPFSKGDRLIIVHAGSEAGFVKGAGLVFKSKSRSGDYHDDMNFDNFQKWLKNELIPNLPANSVLVIDNAPYHNVQVDRCPTQSTLKRDIQEWLRRHDITFDSAMLKPELLELCKRNKPAPTFVVDTILKSHGHDCIRLPPYHADLNAIELIWANLKRQVAVRNFKFNLKEVSALVEEAFGRITASEWKSCCEHVKKVEEKFWQQDIARDEEMERLIISVSSGSDSDTDKAYEGENSETDTAEDSETDTAEEAE